MPEKIAHAPKGADPKEQPVRSRGDKEASLEPDNRKDPPRDTKETPAPNPNGERRDFHAISAPA